MYNREVRSRPLTRVEAEELHGSIGDGTRLFTVEEIMSGQIEKATEARNIITGEWRKPTNNIIIIKA